MYLQEANNWLLNSLRAMALGAKEILQVQIRKQMVESQRRWIFEKSRGEDCAEFLKNVTETLNYAVEHERLAIANGLNEEEVMVMDILWGFVSNNFVPEYVEAAKQIVAEVKEIDPKSFGPVTMRIS